MKTIFFCFLFFYSFSIMGQLNNAWLQKSSFVLIAKIEQTNESTVRGIGNQGMPVIVKVDKVELKPDAVSLPQNGLVTIILNENSEVQKGDIYRFYGLGYIFGKGLAIIEVGHEVPKVYQDDIKQLKKDLLIKEHMKTANLIATGKVIEIRDPEVKQPSYDSEHNPEWKEAIVLLEKILQGPEQEKIIIRFPSSNDVAWYRTPKLKENQEAIFIIRTDKMITGLKEGRIEEQRVNTYVLIDELDVLTKDELTRVEKLLR